MTHQRLRAKLREQIGDGDAHVRVQLTRRGDQLVRACHVGRHRQLEDGRLPGRGQPARDRLADVGQRDRLNLSLVPTWHTLGSRLPTALDVLGDDSAVRAGATERCQIDAALAGDPARER